MLWSASRGLLSCFAWSTDSRISRSSIRGSRRRRAGPLDGCSPGAGLCRAACGPSGCARPRRSSRTSKTRSPRDPSCGPGRCAERFTSCLQRTSGGCCASWLLASSGQRGPLSRAGPGRRGVRQEPDAPLASARRREQAHAPGRLAVLERGGVSPAGQRGFHILSHLAQQGLICFGPREGRQPTFVLLEEWLPMTPEPSRVEGLATLARRYFRSHGPATVRDFAWWTGLPV